jgi:hypothetical protein
MVGRAIGAQDARMQVLASRPSASEQPGRLAVLVPAAFATALFVAALWILATVVGGGLLERVVTPGRTSAYTVVAGVLTWAFAMSAPPAFVLLGYSKASLALARARARRPRVTPAVRLRRALGDDHVVATNLRLPDGSRIVPELVVGPFGVAVVEELPPSEAVVSRGARTWEVRVGSGHIRSVEHPFARATRDATRVRQWLTGNARDEDFPIYAAVVGRDSRLEPAEGVELLAPDQVAKWLAALAPYEPFDAGRRERIVGMIRAAL